MLSGEADLEKIKGMCYQEARKELMKLSGVGEKVADCICLFALHHLEAFPVDTHIKKVLKKNYPQGFPFEKYKGSEGILQQYIFIMICSIRKSEIGNSKCDSYCIFFLAARI